ncbi:hypothetical protein A2U01_0089801, partial [Trifolium medium]|nr:hypothetical protein [Trifolium medium]
MKALDGAVAVVHLPG